jgi:hypothetical protein
VAADESVFDFDQPVSRSPRHTEYADKIIGGIDDFVVDLPPPVAA